MNSIDATYIALLVMVIITINSFTTIVAKNDIKDTIEKTCKVNHEN